MKEWIKDKIIGDTYDKSNLDMLDKMSDMLDDVSLNIIGYKIDDHTEYTILSRNFYSEIVRGVSVRIISSPKDIKFEFERDMEKYFSHLDFARNSVISIVFEEGSVLPVHFHDSNKKIVCVKGSFRDGVSGKVCNSGEIMEIPAEKEHTFEGIDDGIAIMELGSLSENKITFIVDKKKPAGPEDKK